MENERQDRKTKTQPPTLKNIDEERSSRWSKNELENELKSASVKFLLLSQLINKRLITNLNKDQKLKVQQDSLNQTLQHQTILDSPEILLLSQFKELLLII